MESVCLQRQGFLGTVLREISISVDSLDECTEAPITIIILHPNANQTRFCHVLDLESSEQSDVGNFAEQLLVCCPSSQVGMKSIRKYNVLFDTPAKVSNISKEIKSQSLEFHLKIDLNYSSLHENMIECSFHLSLKMFSRTVVICGKRSPPS